jgi:putative peptide zinc metalloprotease protein
LGGLPLPHWTNAQGVIWMPENSVVRAKSACLVAELLATPGAVVHAGTPLLRCEDPSIANDIVVLQAALHEKQMNHFQALQVDPVAAAIAEEALRTAQASLLRAQEKLAELTILSAVDGQFVAPLSQDLLGKFFAKGTAIAYVLQQKPAVVRAVVDQSEVDYVRHRTTRVELRSVSNLAVVHQGIVEREIPGGSQVLPSAVLGTAGGGEIAVDPRLPEGTSTFRNVFEFDIKLLADIHPAVFEERVYVRFYHDPAPLLYSWLRDAQLLLMEHFGV